MFSGTRGGVQGDVALSVSQGHTDKRLERRVHYSEVVRPSDPQQFVRIASAEVDTAIAETVAGLPCSLSDLGITVSTGKVVDFRSKENLCDVPDSDCVPLIYPGNLRGGVIEWPRTSRKPQGFKVNSENDTKMLLPSGCYVVVKRFSAKEERRRLVAAIWDPELRGGAQIAFENHLNVFHVNSEGLDRALAVGLGLWLNSTILDRFFRTFSGHTQVNATDLRSLRFPTSDALRALGNDQQSALPDQDKIDALVQTIIARVRIAA